jgi:hypothetical protein
MRAEGRGTYRGRSVIQLPCLSNSVEYQTRSVRLLAFPALIRHVKVDTHVVRWCLWYEEQKEKCLLFGWRAYAADLSLESPFAAPFAITMRY